MYNLLKSLPLSQIKLFSDSCLCDITETQAPPTIVDWHGRLTLDPPWVSCHQSAIVSPPEQMYTRMSPKRLKCFVVGCNNEHSSRHLLPTSEPLKAEDYICFWRECAPDLPTCAYVMIIHDPASPPDELVSIRFFLCKSPFLKTC